MFEINNQSWSILLVSSNHPELQRSDGSWSIGACDNNLHIIFLNEHLNDVMLQKVLCHEITHAAMFSYGVILTEDQEELIADIIATYGQEIIYITNKVFARMIK